jgi:hypothetical protein
MMAAYIEHGPRCLEIEPEELVIRPRGLDTTLQVWQTEREDSFHYGGPPPRRPHMRIKEVQTKADGPVFVHRIQAEGLARNVDKIESNRLRQPEEGWDEGPMEILTTQPARFGPGDKLPGFDSLWVVGIEKDDLNGHVWRMALDAKGILAPKARKRRITVNGQPVSSSSTLALTNSPGTPFVNEQGVFTGWNDQRYTNLDNSRVVVVDTFLSSEPPPTDKLPGHLTPENAPPVKDLFSYPWWSSSGFTFNWPWGWALKGIQSDQLLDKPLWLVSITTEYVPYAVVR